MPATRMKKAAVAYALALLSAIPASAQRQEGPLDEALARLWQHPTADYRMKTWWFFGYERTTDAGITADAEALRDAGFGGVVYYDQNHARDPEANGADDGFSPQWWQHLRHAATEARRTGLTFELNISNGYCAGGRWIDAAHAMQRVASADTTVSGATAVAMPLPPISGADGYVSNIAVLAFPAHDDGRMRHFTARYAARGKGRNGAMQGPLPLAADGFAGYGYEALPPVGVLQSTTDSVHWTDVLTLAPMYRSQGGYSVRTNAFPATQAKAWRVLLSDSSCLCEGQSGGALKQWHVGSAARPDRWEEQAALQSDFAEGDATPPYSAAEVVALSDIIDLTDHVSGDSLRWTPPPGRWTILRLAAVPTGAKSKHGRPNLLGYECDKLSAEAARLHWHSYVQQLLDRLNTPTERLVSGVTMDSHEGGSQNWTPLMATEFRQRRGYDLRPWLPVLAGYVVQSVESTRRVLYDFRQTIADCVRDNYFGTFQQLAAERGLTFTAQAIGNALCITGDAISVKQAVEKPQGEFWTYQRQGAYDVKDCSSAAHLYGKPIASAEAMTDCEYKDTPADLHRVANIAFSMGAQELVVCATPHIPATEVTEPYVAGRQYAINRSNPLWQQMAPVWEQAARSMVLLRQGRAAPDVLVLLGDDVPVKTLTSRLPDGLEELDWDVCTADALAHRLTATDGQLCTPDGISYRALILARQAHLSPGTQQLVDSIRRAGVPVLTSAEAVSHPLIVGEGKDSVVHTHRKLGSHDLFYLASTQDTPLDVTFRLLSPHATVVVWHNRTGRRTTLQAAADGTFRLHLQPVESVFVCPR